MRVNSTAAARGIPAQRIVCLNGADIVAILAQVGGKIVQAPRPVSNDRPSLMSLVPPVGLGGHE